MGRWSSGRRYVLLVVGVLVPAGVLVAICWPDSPIKIEKDNQRAFRIDPDQPYRISLSRRAPIDNSGTEIVITQDGRVVMARSTDVRGRHALPLTWETATLTLPSEGREKVL